MRTLILLTIAAFFGIVARGWGSCEMGGQNAIPAPTVPHPMVFICQASATSSPTIASKDEAGTPASKGPSAREGMAHFAAPFGIRPGDIIAGGRWSFAATGEAMSFPQGTFKSTNEKNVLRFEGYKDHTTGKFTDIYLSGEGTVTLNDGKVYTLPIKDPPREDFETAVHMLLSKDFLERAKGAWILGELQDPRGIDILSGYVKEPHPYTLKFVQQSLACLKEKCQQPARQPERAGP